MVYHDNFTWPFDWANNSTNYSGIYLSIGDSSSSDEGEQTIEEDVMMQTYR